MYLIMLMHLGTALPSNSLLWHLPSWTLMFGTRGIQPSRSEAQLAVWAPKAVNEGPLQSQPVETSCQPKLTSRFPHSIPTKPHAAHSSTEWGAGLKVRPHHLKGISQLAEGAPAWRGEVWPRSRGFCTWTWEMWTPNRNLQREQGAWLSRMKTSGDQEYHVCEAVSICLPLPQATGRGEGAQGWTRLGVTPQFCI